MMTSSWCVASLVGRRGAPGLVSHMGQSGRVRQSDLVGLVCLVCLVCLVGLLGLLGIGCGGSSGQGNHDAGTGQDGTVGEDGGFTSPVLDRTFGDQGVLRVPSTWSLDRVYAAAWTDSGDLLVGGTSVDLGHRSQLLLGRFTPEGVADPAFGNAGFVLHPLHDLAEVTDLAAVPGGGAVAVGTSWFENHFSFAIRVDDAGDLDPSFGEGGVVLWEGSAEHLAVAVDGAGAVIVLQESSGDAEVLRLTSAGVRDETFGSGGVGSVWGEDARDLILRSDGRILALTHENGTSWVHRLTASGAADPSFGTSGTTTLGFEAFDLALDPTSGALAAAGNADSEGRVARLDADGAPSETFGTGGVAVVTAQESLVRVEWLPSGDLLVLDASLGTFPSARYRTLIRLGPDGQVLPFDTTTADSLYSTNVAALLLGPTGMLLVGDRRVSVDTPAGADLQVTALGLTHDGTPLAGFGQSGLAQAGSHGPSEVLWDLGLLSGGAALAIGSAGVDPILMRFDGGALDTSYGTGGTASGYHTQLGHLAIDVEDRVVATSWAAAVVRFLPDGTVDASFGTNGQLANLPGQVRNLTLDAQQRIVVCGWEATGTEYPMIARYLSDGTPDASFGNSGVVLGFDDATAGFAGVVHVDPDGKIVVGGERFPPGEFPQLCLARLNDDGSMDTSFGQGGVSVLGGSAGANRLLSRRGGGYLLVNHSPYDDPLQVFATLPSGQLDLAFGEGGVVTLEAKEFPVVGLAELADGRILVGGGVAQGDAEQLAVWCLQPDGQLDAGFAEGGLFLLPGMGRATALALDGDGVLVGGFLFHPSSGTDVALLRLLP